MKTTLHFGEIWLDKNSVHINVHGGDLIFLVGWLLRRISRRHQVKAV